MWFNYFNLYIGKRANPLRLASTRRWSKIMSWKYQPTPPKITSCAGQPGGFDPFCDLYFNLRPQPLKKDKNNSTNKNFNL